MTNVDEFIGAFAQLIHQGIGAGTKYNLEPVYALVGFELYDEIKYATSSTLMFRTVNVKELKALEFNGIPLYRDYRITRGIKFVYDEK